jgi:uncharacterized protein involved in exopolysaccharide biosynthesis
MNDQFPDVRQVTSGPPAGYFVVMPMRPDDGRFNLAETLRTLLQSWKLLTVLGLAGAAIAAVIAFNTTPIYRAQVKAVIVDPSEAVGGNALRNQLGGLAALAGFDVGNASGRKQEAFATLKSDGFARDFIVAENLMPVLFADRWDPQKKAWRAGVKQPTIESAVRLFTREVSFITLDLRTGIVDVAIESESPSLAAQWANRAVEMANERIRGEARRTADRSVEYLNRELAKTSVVELQQAIHRLVEVQINNAMLANVQTEYAFRVIDRAVAPEQRVRPKRSIMIAVGGFLGGIVGILFVLGRRSWTRARSGHQTTA